MTCTATAPELQARRATSLQTKLQPGTHLKSVEAAGQDSATKRSLEDPHVGVSATHARLLAGPKENQRQRISVTDEGLLRKKEGDNKAGDTNSHRSIGCYIAGRPKYRRPSVGSGRLRHLLIVQRYHSAK